MDRGEKGINPVAMTITNPRKKKLAEPGIEPATSCSHDLYATNCAMIYIIPPSPGGLYRSSSTLILRLKAVQIIVVYYVLQDIHSF